MKKSRLGELVIRLNALPEFKEFVDDYLVDKRDAAVKMAIHGEGDPAENRGVARGLDILVTEIKDAPAHSKLLNDLKRG